MNKDIQLAAAQNAKRARVAAPARHSPPPRSGAAMPKTPSRIWARALRPQPEGTENIMSAITQAEANAAFEDLLSEVSQPSAQVVDVSPSAAQPPATRPPSMLERMEAKAKAAEAKKANKSRKSPVVEAGVAPAMVREWLEAKAAEDAAIARRKTIQSEIARLGEAALFAYCERSGELESTVNLDGGPLNFTQTRQYSGLKLADLARLAAVVGPANLPRYVRRSMEISLTPAAIETGVEGVLSRVEAALGRDDFERFIACEIKPELTEEFHRDFVMNRDGLRDRVRPLLGRVVKPYSPRVSAPKS